MRRALPERCPLFVRISATDWVEGGWDIEQSVELARRLKSLGVDLIDCSSGGNVEKAKIPVGPGYQTPFADRIRREAEIATAAVGMITAPAQAEQIVRTGQADSCFWPASCCAIPIGRCVPRANSGRPCRGRPNICAPRRAGAPERTPGARDRLRAKVAGEGAEASGADVCCLAVMARRLSRPSTPSCRRMLSRKSAEAPPCGWPGQARP